MNTKIHSAYRHGVGPIRYFQLVNVRLSAAIFPSTYRRCPKLDEKATRVEETIALTSWSPNISLQSDYPGGEGAAMGDPRVWGQRCSWLMAGTKQRAHHSSRLSRPQRELFSLNGSRGDQKLWMIFVFLIARRVNGIVFFTSMENYDLMGREYEWIFFSLSLSLSLSVFLCSFLSVSPKITA